MKKAILLLNRHANMRVIDFRYLIIHSISSLLAFSFKWSRKKKSFLDFPSRGERNVNYSSHYLLTNSKTIMSCMWLEKTFLLATSEEKINSSWYQISSSSSSHKIIIMWWKFVCVVRHKKERDSVTILMVRWTCDLLFLWLVEN